MKGTSTVPAGYAAQVLHVLRGANMQLTSDQPFTRLFGGTAYKITEVVARQRTGAASVACTGGIYTAAAKAGDILVPAAQSWVTLAANINVKAVLAALIDTNLESATPFLSLTVASTAPCTADIFILGFPVD